jgi:hypothetical protein
MARKRSGCPVRKAAAHGCQDQSRTTGIELDVKFVPRRRLVAGRTAAAQGYTRSRLRHDCRSDGGLAAVAENVRATHLLFCSIPS